MRLLEVRTAFVTLELHGPRRPRWFASDTSLPSARVSAASSTGACTLHAVVGDDGELRPVEPGSAGPPLFEETSYRIRVKSLVPGIQPRLDHRDPLLLQDVDRYPEDFMATGPVNFRRQVGTSQLEVYVGRESLSVTLEVFPAKIEYERDYQAMLHEIAGASRALALEYLRATYRGGTADEEAHTTDLDWLLLLRSEIDRLDNSVRQIDRRPQRSLRREAITSRIEHLHRLDAVSRGAIRRGQGRGSWQEIEGIGAVRSVLPAAKARETLDTPEHRWLKLNLRLALDRLSIILLQLENERESYRHDGRASPRLAAEMKEVARFAATITNLQALPIFRDVMTTPPTGFSSLTLLSGLGYREAYRSLMVLRLGLNVFGGPVDMSVMDVHELYEAWCFIAILKIVLSELKGPGDFGDLLGVEERGIRVKLRRGKRSDVTIPGDQLTLTVSYNPSFPGLTGEQRPDIVLRVNREGWPELVIVFDAKYRLDTSDGYRKAFETAGPPVDAINALHRYRDAIVVSTPSGHLSRPVVRGAALFPLALEKSGDFPTSHLADALEVLGIGALPFLPQNQGFVSSWIEELLATPAEHLAEPGPTFAGLAEKHRRETSSNR